MENIIIFICWIVMVILTITEQAQYCKDLNTKDKIIVSVILIAAAPIFCAYTAIAGLLDYFLPEGWGE